MEHSDQSGWESPRRGAASFAPRLGAAVLSLVLVGCGPSQPGGQTEEGNGADRGTTRGTAPIAPRQIDFFSYENNGTVSPQHALAVSIRMSSDGHGVVRAIRGYSRIDSLAFTVDSVKVRQLYDSIRPGLVRAVMESDSGRGPREGEPIGGPVQNFTVTVDGVQYQVGSGGAPSLMPLLPQPWPGLPGSQDST